MVEFYTKQLVGLVGGKVVSVITDPEDGFFGLRVKTPEGLMDLWFLSDDEGNGAGSFEISPVA